MSLLVELHLLFQAFGVSYALLMSRLLIPAISPFGDSTAFFFKVGLEEVEMKISCVTRSSVTSAFCLPWS